MIHRLVPSLGRAAVAASLALTAAIVIDSGSAALANTSAVTLFSDGGTGSLRRAVQIANLDQLPDSIQLGAGTYQLDLAAVLDDDNTNGDLDILSPITITGAGADKTFIDAESIGERAIHVLGTGSLKLVGLTITKGYSGGNGGAIDVVNGSTITLDHVALRSNKAIGQGGALFTNGGMTISNSTFHGNSSTDASKAGGAIYFASTGGPATISQSTFSGNSAAGYGGAIVGSGLPLGLSNVTVSTNQAPTRSALVNQGGAGINNQWTIDRSTITKNFGVGGGAVTEIGNGDNTLINTVVANNLGGSCSGLPSVFGRNIIGDSTCGPNSAALLDLQGASAGLGALADNGGPTFTHAVLAGSPAINSSTCAAGLVDQRNIARPAGACDTGAYERTVIASPDSAAVKVADPFDIAVLGNDLGLDATTIDGNHPGVTLAISKAPLHGTASFVGNVVRYTANTEGADEFTYTVCVDTTCSAAKVTTTATTVPTGPTVPIISYGSDLSEFVPVAPVRILDTRDSGTKPAAGSTTLLTVTGTPGVPATGVVAVVLNVTATEATAPGFVTVYPAGSNQPTASNLNLEFAGQTIPNLVTVRVGTAGQIALFTQSGTHLIADIAGYYRPAVARTAGRFTPVTPTRLLDTRTTNPVGAGSSIDLAVTSVATVPANVSAVVLNVTATNSAAAGFVTVWPAGSARPVVSNLNVVKAGQTIPNLVIVPVGAGGKVSLFSQTGTDLVVDITGWFTDASAPVSTAGLFLPIDPHRVLDSRPNSGLALGGSLDVEVADGDVLAVVLNVTATEATAPGFITVWPTGIARPVVSNLNVERVGQTIPNSAIVGVGGVSSTEVSIFSQSGTDLVVDVAGYYIFD
ncbi:MAG: right-handed parallel beta-helix repeat-containing protein [Ilumatobacteraceae bacterium]